MKALGIVGSPRVDGNSVLITNHALRAVAEEGVETELVSLSGLTLLPCTACMACVEEERCVLEDDLMPLYDKMKAADGIILATPVYFGSATGLMKVFMERTGYIVRNCGGTCKGKVGGPLVVARRGGLTFTLAQMYYWFQTLEFYMPGVKRWNIAVGKEKGDVANDQEGMEAAWDLGKGMAYLMRAVRT
ncbi:MAG: flavodoxin family protein [Dehalococcoidia bacterium]|nr:flavodoxin family protein [Dehalococcoidia bacterium]